MRYFQEQTKQQVKLYKLKAAVMVNLGSHKDDMNTWCLWPYHPERARSCLSTWELLLQSFVQECVYMCVIVCGSVRDLPENSLSSFF